MQIDTVFVYQCRLTLENISSDTTSATLIVSKNVWEFRTIFNGKDRRFSFSPKVSRCFLKFSTIPTKNLEITVQNIIKFKEATKQLSTEQVIPSSYKIAL